jgi:hypothetical protein
MATINTGYTWVSGNVVTPALLNQSVNSATIAGIVNDDVSATAAILGTKVSPNFGSQNIATTGRATVGAAPSTQVRHINSGLVNASIASTSNGQGVVASVTEGGTSAASSAPSFACVRGRGTLGSPAMVADGDWLGAMTFQGHDGTAPVIGAKIQAEVDAAPSAGDMPSRLTFATTADGASTPTERVRIDRNGNVGIGTTAPEATAILHVASSTKGFLPPRLSTTQRNAITSPAEGLMIYNQTTNKLNFYNGTAWEAVTSS